jgi:hypothetical protein
VLVLLLLALELELRLELALELALRVALAVAVAVAVRVAVAVGVPVTEPVHATLLSAKLVGCGNGLGGAEPAVLRVQSPWMPTDVLVWPVPIVPFQPMSVAETDVVPEYVAFQPPLRVWPAGIVNVNVQWVIGSPRFVIESVALKPPDVGEDCHALVLMYVTLQPVAALAWVTAATANPVPSTSAEAATNVRRSPGWWVPRRGWNLMRVLLATICRHRLWSGP